MLKGDGPREWEGKHAGHGAQGRRCGRGSSALVGRTGPGHSGQFRSHHSDYY